MLRLLLSFVLAVAPLLADSRARARPIRVGAPWTLSAVPTTSGTPTVNLSWTQAPAGTTSIQRWTDAAPTPTTIGTTSGKTYSDATVTANTIYYYRLVAAGAVLSTSMPAVFSDITLPFNCPPMVPVAANLLGVDRTESWTAPNGQTISFTIHAPNPGSTVVSVPLSGDTTGATDYAAMAAAIATVKTAGGGTINVAAGNYYFKYPFTGSGFDILIQPGSDIVISGAPLDVNGVPTTHFTCIGSDAAGAAGTRCIALGQTVRTLIRNISIDWNFPNAIPGIVTTIDGTHQKFTIQNPTYYIPDPTHPPALNGVVGYNLTNFSYTQQSGARVGISGIFNTNFSVDGLYYYTLGGNFFPNGAGAIGYVPAENPIYVGAASFDTSLENVWVWGGGGVGLVFGPGGQGLRLSNFVMDRKPNSQLAVGEQPRYVALYGDNDSNATQGNILIENSRIGFIDDDMFYFRGLMQQATITDTSHFTIPSPPTGHLQGSLDTWAFLDPTTGATASLTQPVGTWVNSGVTTVTLASPVPELAAYIGASAVNKPLAYEPNYASANFAVVNSCFHDGHGRIYPRTYNGLIQNNVFANEYYSPLVLPVYLLAQNDGPVAANVLADSNKVIGSGYGTTDTTWLGTDSIADYQTGSAAPAMGISGVAGTSTVSGSGFVPTGYPGQFDWLTNNFVSNAPGVGITVFGAGNSKITGNTIVNANSVAFKTGFQVTFCGANSQPQQPAGSNQPWCIAKVAASGALMAAWTRDTRIFGNTYLGTSAGQTVDPLSTTGISGQ